MFSMVDGSNTPTAWVGIPNWNKDGFYIFGPTANGNETAAYYTNSTWVFNTADTERLRIDASGNVGIGETAPEDLLHIKKNQNAGTQIQIENQNTGASSYAGLNLNGQGNNLTIKNWGDGTSKANATEFISTASGSHFIFSTQSTERLRIDSSGNVGIGDSSPDAKLTVQGDVLARDEFRGK